VLYGAAVKEDAEQGLIAWQAATAPHDLSASSAGPAIALEWTPYKHPVVAGYDLYRRLPGERYPQTPYAHLGRVGSYLDARVSAGQTYSYTVQSRDADGHSHQPAQEVSAVAEPRETEIARTYLALITR
jgi:hypothetical protein